MFSERRLIVSLTPRRSASGGDQPLQELAEVGAQPGITLELQGVGHLVQHDPEPETVHGHPDPARRRGYVPIEKEHLAGLAGPLSREQRPRIVLPEDPGREESEEKPDLRRERRAPDGPGQVIRASGGALQDRLHERSEALDVEVYPLRPAGYPQLASARRALRQLDPGEAAEGIYSPLDRPLVVEVAVRGLLRARGERHGYRPDRAPGDHFRCIAHVVTPLSIYAAKPRDAARCKPDLRGLYLVHARHRWIRRSSSSPCSS